MDENRHLNTHRNLNYHRRRSWCCSFSEPPQSPDTLTLSRSKRTTTALNKPENLSKSTSSVSNSPHSYKSGLGLSRMDPRRIKSPGRVSPIDPVLNVNSVQENVNSVQEKVPEQSLPKKVVESSKKVDPESSRASVPVKNVVSEAGSLDVRLNLKGRNGGCLVLELNSEILSTNSSVFANLVSDCRVGAVSGCAAKFCRIEVPDVENLGVFRQTIELMFEDNITKRLFKIGVYRSIEILEVAASIMFNRAVLSCLNYLEAVPWSEEEEEKLRSLFIRFNFDEATTKDILARLFPHDIAESQDNLAKQLILSITTSSDANARNELKSLVKGLLCKSSVYEKEQPDINREDLYFVCHSCIQSLTTLFEEASGEKPSKKENGKTLIERISIQVDNINWVLEIMLERQIAEEFVQIWANQEDLLNMHENTSPMVRYELSRVSAILFIALGTRKLHCRSEARLGILRAWFGPMLLDFGWLQRCKKGLDMKVLEEALGQALLTLPLKHQYVLFMEWLQSFSKHGTECPNLSKSFHVWWRRSFLRGSDPLAAESR